VDPIARDSHGRAIVDWTTIWDRAGPPAVVAVAVFAAVEAASAGMRRGLVLALVGVVIAGAIVVGAGWAVLSWAAWPLPAPA
jgi:ferric-dicitrate binding protein FerR (iron transport regulator)